MSRVAIVGGGVIGLCCAYYLTHAGHDVTVIDRGHAAFENCSFGNAGLVVPSHIVPLAAPGMVLPALKWMRDPESPFYIKPRLSKDLISWGWKFLRAGTQAHVERSAPHLRDLNMASRRSYEELNSEIGGFEFQKRGLLMLFKTAAGLEEESHIVDMAQRLGMPAEMLTSAEAAQREPNVQMDIEGAVFYPDDCHMSPAKLMRSLHDDLISRSVTFHWNQEVTNWKTKGQQIHSVVTTSVDGKGQKEEIEADEWVLCGGAWSPQTVRQLNLSLPMQAGKGYSILLPEPQHLPSVPAIFAEARVVATPMGETLRIAGTMEIAGLDPKINPARVRGIMKAVPQYYPQFSASDFEGLQAWAGLRPCSPDGLPYVGRTKRYENMCIATGHAMMGLSLGPITGKLITQTISGQKSEIDTAILNPDRFS